ncbi:hypothetical protein FGE12_06690 [Aggregicoccus sp. 17bor-14]|uniref:hypothetical protein n=1 Tax=Myxococcaceae TaxID=31 RepID=UPI00129C9F50|nr:MULTISPECIES: hypothetical protein [Myxococcaceae]MBF5042076.1 hypothetical protein [Simulacricoccus sp. 17bor-14]MRI87854.1 hypothetical protein [Aggregicoccus sp. 17bor-14]
MRERVYAFGPEDSLVGVVTEPAPGTERAGAPGVILTNIGLNHRVGPYRLNVELARALAADGYTVLRFDLSGRGDSEARKDSRTDAERAVLDMREAMDLLQKKRRLERFALVGLCSGVDSVHAVSVQDPRVVGVTWLDGYGYRTRGYQLRWYTLRFLDRGAWRHFLHERLRRLGHGGPAPREVQEQQAVFSREYPQPAALARDVQALVARGVRLLFLYTGGARTEYIYRDQFFDMLGLHALRGQLEVELWREADHLFSSHAMRVQLLARLRTWMAGFAAPASAAAPARRAEG